MSKLIRMMASVKMAIVILTVLSVMVATGTIVEAQFNAGIASKLVYRTWWMSGTLGCLVICLVAVIVDRWPWKVRHAPFILAHIGIIVLLLGALLTVRYGLDGSLRIEINQSSHLVQVDKTELSVFASFDAQNFSNMYQKEVDFYSHRPEAEPISIPTDAGPIQVENYIPFAIPERKVKAVENAGPGLRFQISNERANFSEWMVIKPSQTKVVKDLGPARVSFLYGEDIPKAANGLNEIYLRAQKGSDHLNYAIFYKDPNRKPVTGRLEEGAKIPTGWMGLELRLLRFMPSAEEVWEFKPQDRPTEITTEAIEVSFNGHKQWLQLDDVLRFYTEKAAYIVSYGHKMVDLGFNVHLEQFEIGRHPGISKAMSYQSRVQVSGDYSGTHTISMNEPLKYHGLTIYQASFQEDPATGKPIASIFSVNADPGRWLKYLGSLIIVLGTLLLFYNRRKAARAQAPAANTKVI